MNTGELKIAFIDRSFTVLSSSVIGGACLLLRNSRKRVCDEWSFPAGRPPDCSDLSLAAVVLLFSCDLIEPARIGDLAW